MTWVTKVAEIAKYARESGPWNIGLEKVGKQIQDTISLYTYQLHVVWSKYLPKLPTQVRRTNW